MERTIIFPKFEAHEILVTHVEEEICTQGIINVFDKDGTNIGHVVYDNGNWIFRTVNNGMESDSLAKIMVEYNQYTYKLIT